MGSWIGNEHRDKSGSGCRERGVGCDAADPLEVHGRQRRAGVEAVPAEPENHATDGCDRHVVTGRKAAAVTLELATNARPEGNRTGKGDETTDRVHDR